MAVDLLAKPVLAVDFDWVLHAGSGIAPEGGSIVGDAPVPGAIDWLHQVGQAFQIVVFSVSASDDESKTQIVNWLTEAGFSGIPYQVTDVKPVAHAYVDDRGWRFDGPGSFPSVKDLAAFEPWWKQDAAPGADLNAKALALSARAAEPVVTRDMTDAVAGNGGQLVGAQNRLKDEGQLAKKIQARADAQNVPNSDAAATIHDALRYAATFPPGTYTKNVHGALDGLEQAGYTTERVRNYWAPQSPPGTQQPLGTYKGINAVMRAPGGTPFEAQFHTPDSWQVNADQNWPLYAQLRDGDLTDDQRGRTVEQMRGNLADVPTPAGASTFERPRLVPKPDIVPPLTAGGERYEMRLAKPGDAVTVSVRGGGNPWVRDLAAAMARPVNEPVESIVAVAEKHQPDGGYGDTAWNPDTKTVMWVCGDWTTSDEADAAEQDFLAIPGVEHFEPEWESMPTGWCDAEVVYGHPRMFETACADRAAVTAAGAKDEFAAKPDIDVHNRIVKAGAKRAFDELEPKLAKLVEPVLRKAGAVAARNFTKMTTKAMTASAYRHADLMRIAAGHDWRPCLTAAAPASNSTMIALKPTPEQAAALAWKYGEDAQHLHVTLMLLGGTSGDLDHVAQAVRAVAANHAPLSGQVSGHGQFGPDSKAIDILLPDVPGLVELRCALAEALVDADIGYARDHGFEAHMTVSYQRNGTFPDAVHYREATGRGGEGEECGRCSFFEPQGYCRMFSTAAGWHMVCDEWTDDHVEMTTVGAPLDFDAILIVRGDSEVIELPLVGPPPLTAAVLGPPVRRVETAQGVAAQTSAQELAAAKAQAALASAMDELHNAQHALDVARQRHDPELVTEAEHRVKTAREDVRRALAEANPEEPGGTTEPPTTDEPVITPPTATPVTTPLQPPTTIQQVVQPPSDLPSTLQQTAQNKAQDIFTNVPGLPDQSTDTTGGFKTAEEAIQEAGFIAQPDEQYIERVEETPAEWVLPAGDELLNVDELAQQVRGVTDPVRQAVIRTVGEPIVNSVGLQWDDANPFSAKVLAQSASQITSISDTTQANVMQIIQQAHDNGWTIPQTADAIQQGMSDASPERATLIARTELAGAVNGGSLAATQIVQSATGVQYQKVWRTSPGARYPRHELYPDLDGETADTLDGLFTVGDAELAYPGDPSGPPGEVCNCRCTLTYQEAPATADQPATDAPPDDQQVAAQAKTGQTPAAIPQSPPPDAFHTSDPEAAAKALANGQYVVLDQPDQLSTFIDDLGKISADAQAAGEAAPNLDLGRVSVKGTNLFTQDSLGVPRIDMPQLSGDPLPGSLAARLPKIGDGYEGDPNAVDVGPIFYQQLRDQGVNITSENVLASHLRSTQRDINGVKVAKLMDEFEAGTATERVIPVSRDNYILDGHHQWAATVGMDYKTGVDAGLTIPVMKIDQPITQILAEANSFDDHYGIPHVSAFVPKVTDPAMDARLDNAAAVVEPVVAPKDPILGITPFVRREVPPLFRGLHGRDAAGGAAATRAGELGGGDLGKGIYMTRSVDGAQGYAQSFSGDTTGVVIRGGLSPDAKVATDADIPKDTRYPADWARANGFDAYDDGGNTVVVVNPSKMTWDDTNYSVAETAKYDWAGKQPILAGDETAGFYNTAKAKQFEADLRTEAANDNLTLGTVDRTSGVWEGATEPSYSVHVYGDQAKVQQFAETMRNRYDQDGVMVFTPKKDLPAGLDVNSVEYQITGVDPDQAFGLLSKYGFSGATASGRSIEIVATDADGANAAALAAKLGGTFSAREGHVQFVERK